MADKTWFRINAKAGERPEVVIYDEIGIWGVTASSFHKELKALGLKPGDEMDLRLNTPGGDVFTGNALFNMLNETGATITVYVDGVAASMGSLIAMVGSPVVMAGNAMMMVHNPAAYAHGDSKAMRRMNQLLDSLKAGMVSAYVKKSGLSENEVSEMMEEETWMTAEDAVAYGFADSIGPDKEVHAVDLSRFKSPPRIEAFVKGRKPPTKEVHDMDKTEVASMIEAANKPILDALAKLAPTTSPEAKAESAEDIAKRVNAERDAYEAEINALCDDFGKPEAAAAFIKDKKTAADVRASLRLERDKKAKPKAGDAPRNHVAEDGQSTGGEDHSDLVVQSLNHTDIWSRYNRKAGAIQRVVPAADKTAA